MTITSLASHLALLALAGLVFAAAISDILRFRIPNRICLALVLLYPAYVLAASQPVAWLPAVTVALACLLAGFILFLFNACGAGDAKLFAAVALWAGPALILPLGLYTSLAGGVMVLFLWLQHRLARAPSAAMVLQTATDPGFSKQPMPYGAAIAVGGLYVAFTLLRVN
ncbi:MAG: prepilin peptidase [Limibaculum sp.]